MKRLVVDLTDAEDKRLTDLSVARKKTPEECIKDFIRSCQPGGSGWKPPCESMYEQPKEQKK